MLFNKKSQQNNNDFLADPLEGEEGLGGANGSLENPAARAKQTREQNEKIINRYRKSPFDRMKDIGKTEILRPENINRMESTDDIDEDAVISTYLPRRRLRLLALALLRMDKLRLFILSCLLVVAIIFIMSFMQEKMGNFTINLDRLELYRKGISIADEPNFIEPTARLSASPVANATNISINDLPDNISEVDGDHNGVNYMAYTYYIRNAGKEDVAYSASIVLDASSKGAEDAVRVAVWYNGEYHLYAEPALDGNPEPGCESFESRYVVCTFTEDEFLVGNVDKYTVAIWLEGDDPECVDRIVGGSIELSMKLTSAESEDTSLIAKYIQDIIDTLKGNNPINAAGTESPDFSYNNVTYDTRRNQ